MLSFALPCLALPCLALLCLALPCLALLCLALPCLALLCFALISFPFLCFALLCLALPCLALLFFFFTLLCFTLLCLALPYLTLHSFTLHFYSIYKDANVNEDGCKICIFTFSVFLLVYFIRSFLNSREGVHVKKKKNRNFNFEDAQRLKRFLTLLITFFGKPQISVSKEDDATSEAGVICVKGVSPGFSQLHDSAKQNIWGMGPALLSCIPT